MCVGTPSAGLAWGPCVRVDLDVVWSTRAMASKACVFVPLVRGVTGLLGPLAWVLVPAGWCPLSNSRHPCMSKGLLCPFRYAGLILM